jgi:hypothetical protein
MTFENFLSTVNGEEKDIITYTGDDAIQAVEQNGYALQYIKDQTEDVCLKAVEQNGDALRYVKDQTEDVCLKAVEQNGYALRYVNKLVFEATAIMQVTVADIEAKFGCSIKIVRAKDE